MVWNRLPSSSIPHLMLVTVLASCSFVVPRPGDDASQRYDEFSILIERLEEQREDGEADFEGFLREHPDLAEFEPRLGHDWDSAIATLYALRSDCFVQVDTFCSGTLTLGAYAVAEPWFGVFLAPGILVSVVSDAVRLPWFAVEGTIRSSRVEERWLTQAAEDLAVARSLGLDRAVLRSEEACAPDWGSRPHLDEVGYDSEWLAGQVGSGERSTSRESSDG